MPKTIRKARSKNSTAVRKTRSKNSTAVSNNLTRDSDKLEFFYLRDENHAPRVCFAFKPGEVSDLGSCVIRYSFSVTGPFDTPSKKIGRNISQGRLKSGSYRIVQWDGGELRHSNMRDLIVHLLKDMRDHYGFGCSTMSRLAKSYIQEHEENQQLSEGLSIKVLGGEE